MNLVFDIYPALTPRGTRLVRLSRSHLGPGSGFRKELVGLGQGTIVINAHQAEATAANFTLDNYVEVIDLDLGDPIDGESLGAFFLEEGDFTAVSADEQSGRMLTFTGRGELSYLDRGILGPDALADYAGPFDQYVLDTEGMWRWGATPTATETYGGVLRRIIYESCLLTPNPHPEVLPSGDINWNDITDSDGNAWPTFTSNYDIEVGTNLLDAIGELLTNGIELIGNADFSYDAYVAGTYGTDRSSATFASGKVRFAAGVNIAADLERAVHGSALASHTIVVDATGASNDLVVNAGYGGVVKYVGIRAPQQSGPDDLEALGENILRNRNEFADQFSFPHPPGEAPLTGLYTPGPPGGEGHYWVGDTVTIHTGTGPYDANEQAIRVAAIEWGIDDAGNWLPTVELGAQYLSVAGAGFSNQLTTMVSRPHTHPPNPALCRPGSVGAGAFLGSACSASASNLTTGYGPWGSDTEERIELELAGPADVGVSLVAVVGYTKNYSVANQVYDEAGNTWTKDAEHENTGSSNDDTAAIWRCTVTNALAAGDYVRFAARVTGAGATVETGGRCIGVYRFPRCVVVTHRRHRGGSFSGSASITAPAGEVVVAALAVADSATAITLTPDPDWQPLVAHDMVGGSGDLNAGVYAQVLEDAASTSWTVPISASQDWAAIAVGYAFAPGLAALDGHPDLVGTSIRAARCDHRHDLHRDTAPTVNDDEDDGYRVGVIWAQLDDLATPTAITGVWILADATAGAAVWLELPTGGGGATIEVEDEGSNEGSVDTLNFSGAGVSVTVTGSEAEVIIPGGGGKPFANRVVAASHLAFETASNENAAPGVSTAYANTITIPGPMRLRSAKFRMQAAASGTYQWGLFDVTASTTAATKLAGGSGALNATGWVAIAASGGPIDVAAGCYVFIFHAPAANVGSMYRASAGTSGIGTSQAAYTWDDTPTFASGWAVSGTDGWHYFLLGDLTSSQTWP